MCGTINGLTEKGAPDSYPPIKGDPDLRVASLTEGEMRCWISEKVKDLFLGFEAEDVLGIPTCHSITEHRLVWHYSKDRKIFSEN